MLLIYRPTLNWIDQNEKTKKKPSEGVEMIHHSTYPLIAVRWKWTNRHLAEKNSLQNFGWKKLTEIVTFFSIFHFGMKQFIFFYQHFSDRKKCDVSVCVLILKFSFES